jgi:aryl-alcohol dehydrogenase-like predicted oxidoreductase
MGVIVKEALANGRLTDRNAAPEFAAPRRLLRQAADEAGIAIDTLALAVVLAQPWAGVVLSGAARVEHLASNVAAVAVVAERAEWLAGWLPRLSALAEPAEQYWQRRAALAWN